MKLSAKAPQHTLTFKLPCICAAILCCVSCHGQRAYLSGGDAEWLSYQRTMCFGPCPAFTLTVAPDGSATYTGKANVERIGTYTADWSQEQMHEIASIAAAMRLDRKAGVYDNPLITDLPATQIALGPHEVMDRFNGPDLSGLYAALDSLIEVTPWTPESKQ